jgi:ADP-ribose pyrophosphatase YjhB (NUDIX family)
MAFYRHGEIEIKVMCIIRNKENILVSRGYDHAKKEAFYRLLGGSVEFGETTDAAMRREIHEELGSEMENLHSLDMIQNIFTYEGEARHQITFLYAGELANKSLYAQEAIHVVDVTSEFDAIWVPVAKILSGEALLYPEYDYATVFHSA